VLFREPDGAQRQRVHLIHDGPGRQDDFQAPAPDIGHGHGAPFQIEPPHGALEGQPGFLLGRNDFDADAVPAPGLAAEGVPVLGFADGAGAGGAQLGDPESVGDRLHLAEGLEGPLDGLGGHVAGAREPRAEARHLALLVEHAIGPVGLDFRDDEPDGVGADVYRAQARRGRPGWRAGHGVSPPGWVQPSVRRPGAYRTNMASAQPTARASTRA
jgi:hypothetical protein